MCKYVYVWISTNGGDSTHKMFAFRDLTIRSLNLLNDGDSVYTPENLYENLGTPVKSCLICTGTSVKTC